MRVMMLVLSMWCALSGAKAYAEGAAFSLCRGTLSFSANSSSTYSNLLKVLTTTKGAMTAKELRLLARESKPRNPFDLFDLCLNAAERFSFNRAIMKLLPVVGEVEWKTIRRELNALADDSDLITEERGIASDMTTFVFAPRVMGQHSYPSGSGRINAAFTMADQGLGLIVDDDLPRFVDVQRGRDFPLLHDTISSHGFSVLKMSSGVILITGERSDLTTNLFQIDLDGNLKLLKEGFQPTARYRFGPTSVKVRPGESAEGEPRLLEVYEASDVKREGVVAVLETDPYSKKSKELPVKDFKDIRKISAKWAELSSRLPDPYETLVISKSENNFEILNGGFSLVRVKQISIYDESTDVLETYDPPESFRPSNLRILNVGKKRILLDMPFRESEPVKIFNLEVPAFTYLDLQEFKASLFKLVYATSDHRIEAVYDSVGEYKIIQLYGPLTNPGGRP